jgi:hypothetical protein
MQRSNRFGDLDVHAGGPPLGIRGLAETIDPTTWLLK